LTEVRRAPPDDRRLAFYALSFEQKLQLLEGPGLQSGPDAAPLFRLSPGLRARWTDSAQGFAEQVLDARASKGVVLAQLCEHRTDLALLEAHVAEPGEEPGLDVEHLRLERLTVRSAVAMEEANAATRVPFDEERPLMGRSVVSSAERQNIPNDIATALGTQLDMVQIEKRGVFAARHSAAVVIAYEHGAA